MALALVVSTADRAYANGPMGNDFGLGFALGNPTSFTGKYYMSGEEAVDFHIGLYRSYQRSYYGETLFLAGDYIFEVWNFMDDSSVKLPFYVGPGAALLMRTGDRYCHRYRRGSCVSYNFGFGPRMPIGVALQFQKAPFEIFLEMSPTLLMLFHEHDGSRVDISIANFALGGRFYF
jgi:hypothetical protein